MYNAERGEFGLKMGGKDVVLRPTHESWQKLRALTGVGELKLLATLEDDNFAWGINDLVSIVWAGRDGAGESVTIEQCYQDCMEYGILRLQPVCHEYLCRALMGGKTAAESRGEKKVKKA